MARASKVAVVDDVSAELRQAPASVLTEYRGLSVAKLAALRAELRKTGTRYRIAKNTLIRLAAKTAGLEIPDEALTGPTAVAFTGDDPIAAAKALRKFSRENPSLVVKGAVLEGRYLGPEEAGKLADLASREELLAQAAGLMQSLLASPARLANANLSKAARLFQALADKKAADGDAEAA